MVTWQDNSILSYDQWLLARNKSIGASEVGAIVFGSKWTSNIEIFYHKIGWPSNKLENIRMYLGKETEELSAKMWTYYNGTEQSVVENGRNNTPVKKCENKNATAFNSEYPHLSATPDRIIQPFGKYESRGVGSLEIKNTMGYVLKSYENNLPTENVIQVVTQDMVCNFEYGELFYFVDNMRFELYTLEQSDYKNIEQIILDFTCPFWENVLLARPLFNQMFEAKRNFDQRLVNQLEKEIERLEPPVQNTNGYRDFLTQKFKDRQAGTGLVAGTLEQHDWARKHKILDKQIKELEVEQRDMEIKLKSAIGNMSSLDFGKGGSVSWFENKNSKRVFLNKSK